MRVRRLLRLAAVTTAAALSFGAFAPALADEHSGGQTIEGGLEESFWFFANTLQGEGRYGSQCGEYGLDRLKLGYPIDVQIYPAPVASGVIHHGVEPIVAGVDDQVLGDQGANEFVHQVNCDHVVPWERDLAWHWNEWSDAVEWHAWEWGQTVTWHYAQWEAVLLASPAWYYFTVVCGQVPTCAGWL